MTNDQLLKLYIKAYTSKNAAAPVYTPMQNTAVSRPITQRPVSKSTTAEQHIVPPLNMVSKGDTIWKYWNQSGRQMPWKAFHKGFLEANPDHAKTLVPGKAWFFPKDHPAMN